MITDNQRREVAKRLRELDVSDIEVDGCIIDSPKYVGLLLMRMLDAACDYRDGLHHFPGFFSAREVVELFADLIDPQTTPYICEKCGGEWPSDIMFECCPYCGAEVLDEDVQPAPAVEMDAAPRYRPRAVCRDDRRGSRDDQENHG